MLGVERGRSGGLWKSCANGYTKFNDGKKKEVSPHEKKKKKKRVKEGRVWLVWLAGWQAGCESWESNLISAPPL